MKLISAICLLALASPAAIAQSKSVTEVPASRKAAVPNSDSEGKIREAYGKLPLSFEANQGQTNPDVKFLSRGAGYTLFLTSEEAVLALRDERPAPRGQVREAVPLDQPMTQVGRTTRALRIRLLDSNPDAKVVGTDKLPGKTNYLLGNNPKNWRANVANYAKVRYQNVYPGIDLVYYGNQGQLEYDFVVGANADPQVIRMALDMASPGESSRAHHGARARTDKSGDLVVKIGRREVRMHKPVVYQVASADGVSQREEVAGGFAINGANEVSFHVGNYDRSRSLVIDPGLGYSTYIGGSGNDYGNAIAVDSAGDAYVVGQTASSDFPLTSGAYQTSCGGGSCVASDVFVTKLDPTGSTLLYSTYIGGSGVDLANGIALDPSENAYVVGQTYSSDFPVTAGAFQSACAGACRSSDAFVLELSSTGSALVYSTYLGGGRYDQGNAIVLDASQNAYVTGTTCSQNFPTTAGAFQLRFAGDMGKCKLAVPGGDAFITEVNSTGTAVLYSTYLGGSGGDTGYSIALDSSNNAYVAGYTYSTDFPTTAGAFQTSLGTSTQAGYLTKMNPTGTAPVYSTYLSGTGPGNPCDSCATAVAVDPAGDAFVTGLTLQTTFPVTSNAFQKTHAGGTGHDGFITEFNPSGSGLIYSTFLGGSGDDGITSIALNGGRVYIRGNTSAADFPVTRNAFQPAFAGQFDVFVTKFVPGETPSYSSYLGGTAREWGVATSMLALGSGINPAAYITGLSESSDFPVTTGAFQTSLGGLYDAFAAEFTFSTTADSPSPADQNKSPENKQ